MQRIERSRPGDKDLALRILSWLFHTQRALRMDELLEALVVEELEPKEEFEDMLQNMLAPDEVIECCQSLVLYEESSGSVRFSHYTVQEFIASHLQTLPPNVDLAKSCLNYLAFAKLDEPCLDRVSVQMRVQKYKFSQYAAQYWSVHTAGKAEESPEIQLAILHVFGSDAKRNAILQLDTYANSRWGNISFTKGQTLLHVLAHKGLVTLCMLVLDGVLNTNDTYLLVLVVEG